MQRPDFWQERSLKSTCLMPLGWLYSTTGLLRRALTKPARAKCPVVCVGNLTVGGSGKTPLVAALAEALIKEGFNPHILSRGYGGKLSSPTPVRVDPTHHKAGDVGDEPLLLSYIAPVWIGSDRTRSARQATEASADILIMDDGFQNPGLHKDFSIIVVDAGYGFGNERVMPAGPLRENLHSGFKRADLIVTIGRSQTTLSTGELPVVEGVLKPCPRTASRLNGRDVLAFAGIGRPEKFHDSLRELGARVVETKDFPDHHPYSPAELKTLHDQAEASGLQLVTTEKDAIKLSAEMRKNVEILPVRLEWQDPKAFQDLLNRLQSL
ncbi:tetraacyldisaccharide 4'-kinase [Kiloniella sp. b19]|uniref:tetraacyldisaccharide 4'-kinase n=1 Tax=Kiloniella sp. GXU_MW_B19 TaxID=3141326 RepID=UPI0031CFBC67